MAAEHAHHARGCTLDAAVRLAHVRLAGGRAAVESDTTTTMAAPPPPIASLFVTLRRGMAGVREHHVRIVESLGLKHREHTVELSNSASARGAIDKVSAVVVRRAVVAVHAHA